MTFSSRAAATALLSLASFSFLTLGACSGGSTGGGGGDGDGGSSVTPNDPIGSSSGSSGSSGKPSTPSDEAPTCKVSEDCPNWFCECEKGPPVNTRHCTNGRCENAAVACPKSCKSFGTCWTGQAGGGWDGGTNSGPNECKAPALADAGTKNGCGDNTAFTDLGKACTGGTQCQSGQCYGLSPSFVCTKRCTTEQECPKDWKCATNGDGFKTCAQGDKSATGPLSTNASCAQVSFTDLGGACSIPQHCQSFICINQGSYCSRRCKVAADCPSGWTCTTGTNMKFCTK